MYGRWESGGQENGEKKNINFKIFLCRREGKMKRYIFFEGHLPISAFKFKESKQKNYNSNLIKPTH